MIDRNDAVERRVQDRCLPRLTLADGLLSSFPVVDARTTVEGFLSASSVLDIGAHSTPFDYLAGCVGYRGSTEEEPSILPIEASQARLHFTALAIREC